MAVLTERYNAFYDWFWTKEIWLPPGMTWDTVKANKNPVAVQFGDVYFCLPVAVLLIILRIFFEKFIARRIVLYLGVKDKKPVKVVASELCEQVYRKTRNPGKDQLQELSGKLGWSAREVERWFRRRPAKYTLPPLRKATECCWRFIFYFTVTVYGFYILYDKRWFWNLDESFTEVTTNVIPMEFYIYYVAELGMYISLSISQFSDVKRKDFWQHMVHHASTIVLLLYSYMSGYFRIGAIVVFVHDVSDIFLEAAKLFHYAKLQRICDVLFAVFTVVFYISRLIILPFWVIHACLFANLKYVGDFFVWRCMFVLLLVLQVLHIYWAKFIMTILIRALTGKGVEDVRSDEEYISEGEENDSNAANDASQEQAKKEM